MPILSHAVLNLNIFIEKYSRKSFERKTIKQPVQKQIVYNTRHLLNETLNIKSLLV